MKDGKKENTYQNDKKKKVKGKEEVGKKKNSNKIRTRRTNTTLTSKARQKEGNNSKKGFSVKSTSSVVKENKKSEDILLDTDLSFKGKKNVRKDIAKEKKSFSFLGQRNDEKKKVESSAVQLYKKKKEMKQKNKKFSGKFHLDILDLLILIVIIAIVSCVLTGIILNFQFKRSMHLINSDVVTDKNVQDFLNTYSEIVENYYEEIDSEEMMKAAMSGMLNFLEDNYSIYLNKDESDNLSDSLDGSYNGIGILIQGNVIESVYKNSPAANAGIHVGDEIVEVNGSSINMENYDDISGLINMEGENILVVKRKDKEITFTLKASTVNIPATTSDIIKSTNGKKTIGYISLHTFSSLAFEDFKDSLTTLEEEKKIDSLIIDVRGNTGGYLNVATNITSLFLERNKVIYSLESKNKVTDYKDETDDKRDYKIVVLVNGSTASASEILASALHDSYGAKIVGKKTFGKGKVQTMKHYEDSILKYTSAKWLRPNGECVDEVGIVPDYEVDLVIEDDTIYDKQLDKAIELLSK